MIQKAVDKKVFPTIGLVRARPDPSPSRDRGRSLRTNPGRGPGGPWTRGAKRASTRPRSTTTTDRPSASTPKNPEIPDASAFERRPSRAAAGGFPVRVSHRRLATSRLGRQTDDSLRKGDGCRGSQHPGGGAHPQQPPAADLVARRTPYDLRRWESAAQALLVRRNATLTIERRSGGAGARPESIRTAPAATSTPLSATHRRRSRLPGPGSDLGHRFTSGQRPRWPDTK